MINLEEIIESCYSELIRNKDIEYNEKGLRGIIASKTSTLLLELDNLDKTGGITIDNKIFDFLSFMSGYDMPNFEDDKYLYSSLDLESEFQKLGKLDSLDGSKYLVKFKL